MRDSATGSFPGTEIYRNAVKKGKIPENPDSPLAGKTANTTMIYDDVYQRMLKRINTFRESIVIPARNYKLEPEDEPRFDGLRMLRVTWDCPRCDHHNVFSHFRADWPHQSQAFCLVCRSCRTRFDVPNQAAPQRRDADEEAAYREAAALRERGDLDGAVRKYNEIVTGSLHFSQVSEAYSQAAYDLGLLYLSELGDPAAATDFLALAVLNRAFDPDFQIAFAIALTTEGAHDAAKLHCETALRLLDEDDDKKRPVFEQILDQILERRKGSEASTFFLE